MRLIDADNISFHCDHEGDCTGNINDCKKCENYICIFRDIQEQPTAYSVDKVVEELEHKKEEVQRMRNTCVALSDLEVCDIENVTYKRAIEIVKAGDNS